MVEKYSGYEDVANIELARRRTFEKTAAAYSVSRDSRIVRKAEDYIAKNRGTKDSIKRGTVDGYLDFLRSL